MSGLETEDQSEQQQLEERKLIEVIIAEHGEQPGTLLAILQQLQQSMGYISETAVPQIADALNLSRADVHGVISFYHDFRRSKPGKYLIHVCRGESCQAMGMKALEQHIKNTLQIDYQQTTADGLFSLKPVYCLGNCACSPSIRIAHQIYAHVDAQSFDQILDSLQNASDGVYAL